MLSNSSSNNQYPLMNKKNQTNEIKSPYLLKKNFNKYKSLFDLTNFTSLKPHHLN